MHYKNGRPVTVGDWVVGPTHNSKNALCVAYVTGIMPEQGPCNIKLFIWSSEYCDDGDGGTPFTIPIEKAPPKIDYGDAKEFITCADGRRMVSAIWGHGRWDGPYM